MGIQRVRSFIRILIIPGVSLATGLGAAWATPNVPVTQNGWDIYGGSSHATCHVLPVLLIGDRQDLKVDGECAMVRVAGNHNDISVVLAPGGTIEITGAHNDVTWHYLSRSRLPPRLVDHGESNTFHTGE